MTTKRTKRVAKKAAPQPLATFDAKEVEIVSDAKKRSDDLNVKARTAHQTYQNYWAFLKLKYSLPDGCWMDKDGKAWGPEDG